MKIQMLITVGGGSFLATIVAAAAAIFFAYVDLANTYQRNIKITGIQEASSELSVLTGEYLLYRERRAEAQWLGKHESLGRTLSTYRAVNEWEIQEVERLRSQYTEAKEVFRRLTTINRPLSLEKTAPQYVHGPLEARMAAQLLTTLHTMVGVSSRLVGRLAASMEKTIRNLLLIMASTFFAIYLLFTVIWILINRRVAQPVALLHEGIDTIAGGDLDHQIMKIYEDEVGVISERINAMAGNLKETLVSRDALMDEVAHRKEAEISLRKSEAGLNKAQGIAHLGSWNWNIGSNALS